MEEVAVEDLAVHLALLGLQAHQAHLVHLDHQVLANLAAVAVPAVPAARETQAQPGKSPLNPRTNSSKTNPPNSSSSSISPSYGGGRYFAGGSSSAYRSGSRSPSGIAPFALLGAGLLIFPGLWLYGAYEYNYNHPYSFHNASNASQPANQNETLPVTCLCQQYSACGCDNNDNSTYLGELIGNGSMADQNSSLVHVGDVNGTKTIVINGTLPNGTDDSGTDNGTTSSDSSTSTGGATRSMLLENSGYWVMGATVAAMIWML